MNAPRSTLDYSPWGKAAAVGLLPIGVYFWLLHKYAVNVPLFDDHAFKDFILQFNQADFGKRLTLIVALHNEHRIAYDRLVVLFSYWLSGEINYVTLMWVGNLSLVGILCLFLRVGVRVKLPQPLLMALPFVLFTLLLHENTFWGMAALQNFTVLWWVLLCFYLIPKQNNWAFVTAAAAAVAATYTSGNGLLAFGVAAGVLVLQRRWKPTAVWLSLAIGCAAGYFYGYQRPPGNPAEATGGSLGDLLQGFMLFLGNLADINVQRPLSFRVLITTLTGFGLLTWSAWLMLGWLRQTILWRRKGDLDESRYFLLGVLVFSLLTALLVSVTRLGFGIQVLLTSRYKIYAVLLVITSVVGGGMSFALLRNKIVASAIGLAAIVFWALSLFYTFDEILYHRQYKLSSMANSIQPESRIKVPYNPPLHLFEWPEAGAKSVVKAQMLPYEPTQYVLTFGSIEAARRVDTELYCVVQNAIHRLVYPCRRNRLSPWGLMRSGDYYNEGLWVSLPRSEIPTGTYRVVLVQNVAGQWTQLAVDKPLIAQKIQGVEVPVNW